MTTPTDKHTVLNLGEITRAMLAIFIPTSTQPQGTDHRYILCTNEVQYLDLLTRYPKYDIKRVTEYHIEEPDGQWFYFANVDCFDPPLAIIRDRSFEDAYETFCDEWERWLKVDEADAADYADEDRDYNNNGTHIDTDNVQGGKLSLITVEVL